MISLLDRARLRGYRALWLLVALLPGCAFDLEEKPPQPRRPEGAALTLEGPYVVGLRHSDGTEIRSDSGKATQLAAGLRAVDGRWMISRGGLERAEADLSRAALTQTSFGAPRRQDLSGQVRTIVQPRDDGFVLTQSGNLNEGCSARAWGMVLPSDVTIIVPGDDGTFFDASSPLGEQRFEYPWQWESAFVLVQKGRAGWLIRTEGFEDAFHELTVVRTEAGFTLRFGTESWAPFGRGSEPPAVPWRIEPYEGHWTVGAERYRQDWLRRGEPARVHREKPDWVKDIALVVRHDVSDRAGLELLAQQIEPRRVLIYSVDWRRSRYDFEYPTYVERPRFSGDLAYAQSLGFRVMLHVNFIGCSYEHPAFEELRPYQVRGQFDGAPKEWVNEPSGNRFAVINPAARVWREFFVAEMRRLVGRLRPDALHLDQNGNIENDANGRIDGLTMIEGVRALHASLVDALPELAFAGEDLSEITAPYLDFCQRRPEGASAPIPAVSWLRLEQCHAITSYLFDDQVASYGTLGTIAADQASVRLAWELAFDRWGVLPTWMTTGPAAFQRLNALSRSFLLEARFRGETSPRISRNPADWEDDALIAYRCGDGALVKVVEQEDGWTYAGDGAPALSFLKGQWSADQAWWVPNWPMSGQDGLAVGLDPGRPYVASTRSWLPVEPWITWLDGGRPALVDWSRADDATTLTFKPSSRPLVDLLARREGVSSGVTFEPNTPPMRVDGLSVFAPGGGWVWASGGQVRMTPPPREPGGTVGPNGPRTFVEWRLELPEVPSRLELDLAPLAFRFAAATDVRLTVRAGAWQREEMLAFGGRDRETMRIDLGKIVGRRAVVRLEVLASGFEADEPRPVVVYGARLVATRVLPFTIQPETAVTRAIQGRQWLDYREGRVRVPGRGTVVLLTDADGPLPVFAATPDIGREPWRRLSPEAGEVLPAVSLMPNVLTEERRTIYGEVREGGRLTGRVSLPSKAGHAECRLEVAGEILWQARLERDHETASFDIDLSEFAGGPLAVDLVVDPLGWQTHDVTLWSFGR
ncbi:MAG: DUF6259 domain-containing protein [Planctomycetota bacterium]